MKTFTLAALLLLMSSSIARAEDLSRVSTTDLWGRNLKLAAVDGILICDLGGAATLAMLAMQLYPLFDTNPWTEAFEKERQEFCATKEKEADVIRKELTNRDAMPMALPPATATGAR